jgi:methyl-accepting chemotaxis protein
VEKTAEGASHADGVVGEARHEAEQSGEIVRRAVAAMTGIERSSAEISDIITSSTASPSRPTCSRSTRASKGRAGHAGRGFAVGSSEVRALAQRSSEAAKDVKTRILASSEQVDVDVELVGETGKALNRIIVRIGEANGLVPTIATSAEQQATGLLQVNTAASEMAGVT